MPLPKNRSMKKIVISLLVLVLQYTVFSQSDKAVIKISDELVLLKISDHAYIHVSYTNLPPYGRVSANGFLLTDNDRAFLFDSPWTYDQTEKLITWLSDSLHVKVIWFIPNHWHADCMGGLAYIREQHIRSYANQLTINIAISKGLPVPEQGFNDSLELRLGEMVIKCYYLGAAHSLDNIVVWIPSEHILFAGCTIKSIGSRNLGNTTDGDLTAYPVTLSKMIQKFHSAEIVIPGHGEYGGIELIKHTLDLTTK
jgi:metallo-beta-lactamase class B